MEQYTHTPVLLDAVIDALQLHPGGLYVDGTTGLGGHSERIAQSGARLVCIDKDREAIAASRERLSPYAERIRFVQGDFRHLEGHLAALGETACDGVLLDLGVSSLQLDKPSRGFSHRLDAPLDMRMDIQAPLSAWEIVNEWSAERLKRIFYDYGEERHAGRIAAAICRSRPLETTTELRDLILSVLPAAARREGGHPARRVFQALRIAVNDELGAAEDGVHAAVRVLAPEGRLCVIAFHSLEDRVVKHLIRDYASRCDCPPSFPVCVCDKTPLLRSVARVVPDAKEIETNPRSASAVMRVAERINGEQHRNGACK